MLITIEKVLALDELARFRARLDAAEWHDGQLTAGTVARGVKRNEQLDDADPAARAMGDEILERLGAHPQFISAALPRRIHPPKFNRYSGGGTYGTHVDGSIMRLPGSGSAMRTDVSATLFLADPDEYEGGELEIEGAFGAQSVKLAAGDLVLYPSTSLHRVTPVSRGARLASFFWIESLVPDAGERALLYDLDQAIQAVGATRPATDPALVCLTGVYHNLLRRWAAT